MNNLYRLSPEIYKQLEGQLPKPIVSANTTEHQIGYLLGIQYVLSTLREGFTVANGEANDPTFRTRAR